MLNAYNDRLNSYRSMWLFVYFDLPTETRKEIQEGQEEEAAAAGQR